MILGAEAIVSNEAKEFLGINPACISLLQDGTRELVWGIIPNNPHLERYHTQRWFSDREKQEIQSMGIEEIKKFLNKYI